MKTRPMPRAGGFFITGIGTDVGKTVASAILAKALQAAYWKPIQCGDLANSDSKKIAGLVPGVVVHPEAYRLSQALSPHAAAARSGISIELAQIKKPRNQRLLLVEGAGGLLVPLNDKHLLLDLIKRLGLPVILVSRHYLGSINHTLMTAAILQSRNIAIAGLVFMGRKNAATEAAIARFSRIKVLGRIPWLKGKAIDASFITQQAKKRPWRELSGT